MNSNQYLKSLVSELTLLSNETEWVEFKVNNKEPQLIGEYISALSNSAALEGKKYAYLLWGVDDNTHEIIGTNFEPKKFKKGNEEVENWLYRLISPKINFKFYEVDIDSKKVVLLEIEKAIEKPVQFSGIEYIRIGSYKKLLKEFPVKERDLWRKFDLSSYEDQIAKANMDESELLNLLDYPSYFDLMDIPLPEERKTIIMKLAEEEIIKKNDSGSWDITNLGAILFAKELSKFKFLKRKAVRVIQYKGNSRIETIREKEGSKGYAVGFEGLISYIDNMLPRNEIIGKALRKEHPIYPQLAIRELVANAIIHQDFSIRGTGPMIEIFSDRMEITNPGVPLVDIERFIDTPPKSRNESLASFMRRMGICEERGSGFDKVVFETEFYQLPAPVVEAYSEHTKVILFAHKDFKVMTKEEKIHACYLHSCLKYVTRDYLTNASLRERFGLDSKSSATVSRIIKDSLEKGVVKLKDPETAPRYYKYVPFWS